MPKQNLQKRSDGRYKKQVYLGKDINGKRLYKTVYGKTQKEVEKKCNEVRSQIDKGLDLGTQKDTFGMWANKYIQSKRSSVGERTVMGIKGSLKHLSALNDKEITKIKPQHIEDILINLATRAEKPLSRKTLTDIKNNAFGVFRLAIKNRVMDFNPASVIDVPKGTGSTKREALTDEQIQWITETPHNAQTAAMLMLYAGLRRGELIALTWSDIDLKNGTIRVNKAAEYINNKPVVKPMTKTKAGMRLISIPKILVTYLMSIEKKSLIVCTLNGDPMTEGSFRRMWESYMNLLNEKYGNFGIDRSTIKKNGERKSRFAPGGLPIKIDTFTPHQLRHTYASMLYMAGVDVLTAKEQLGHSDIKTTLNIYTHLDSIYKKHSMEKLDEYLQKSS